MRLSGQVGSRGRQWKGTDEKASSLPNTAETSSLGKIFSAGASGRIAQFLPPGGRMSGRPIKRTLRAPCVPLRYAAQSSISRRRRSNRSERA